MMFDVYTTVYCDMLCYVDCIYFSMFFLVGEA